MAVTLSKKYTSIKVFLLLSTLEGFAAFILLFQLRSMDRNVWLFGYSAPRIALAALSLLFILIFSVATLKAFLDSHWLAKISAFLDAKLSTEDCLRALTITLVYAITTGIGLIIIFSSPLAIRFGALQFIFDRSLSLVIWLLLITLQGLIILFINYSQEYDNLNWQAAPILKTLFILIILSITIFHWIILIFRLDILISIPGWFWQFHQKDYSLNDALFLVILFLPLLIVAFIIKNPSHGRRNLALIIFLGLFLQYSFGFVEGEGFESIRLKYAASGHNVYALHASDKPGFIASIQNYEHGYGKHRYLATKPPGVLSVYIITQKISNLINPVKTFDERFLRLTSFITYVYPLLSFLVLIVLYQLNKSLMNKEDAVLPCLLYVFCPSVILMPLFIDQAIYPLVFMLGVLLIMYTLKKQSFALAVISGVVIYIAMFLTFSLLTMLPFAVIWTGVDYFINHKRRSVINALKILLGLVLGVLIIHFMFRLLLNYDMFIRYENMMIVHRYDDFIARYSTIDQSLVDTTYRPGLGEILYGAFLNNISFSAWMGFPMYLLFFLSAARSVIPWIKDQATMLDGLLASFTITFVALNLFGDTAGEVARLWIFMIPLMSIYAGLKIVHLFKRKDHGAYLIISLQLITMILTYKFQDFYS